MPNTAVVKTYSNLLVQIKKTIRFGRKTIELTKALTYWKIGENISKHQLSHNGRAGYGKKLYERLSKDLKIEPRTLERAVQFYREIPIPTPRSELTWTHYRRLITVDDALLRNRLLAKAKKNKLTTRELASEIKQASSIQNRASRMDGQTQKPLIPKRGQLHVYQLIEVDGVLEVDCGFHVTRTLPLPGLASPQAGMRVTSTKTRSGFTFAAFNGARGDLYTYKASSIRVVDGDTITCRIDCGFKTKIKRSLRLRGINAPEIKTAAGRASKRFVQRRLKGKREIILRSYGLDNYGRYVADVFVSLKPSNASKANKTPQPKGTDGATDTYLYLNQELLNHGFARRQR